jgi:hypothetical protein
VISKEWEEEFLRTAITISFMTLWRGRCKLKVLNCNMNIASFKEDYFNYSLFLGGRIINWNLKALLSQP